jgi:hypothetical protein
LQQQSENLGGSWADLSASPTVVNGQNQVTLPMTNGSSFYRLKGQQ